MSDMEGGRAPEQGGTGEGPNVTTLEREPETMTGPVVPPPAQPPGTGTATGEWRDLPHGARRGGIVAGVVLIALGVLVLVGRYAPWGDIFRLWPLIIVIGGFFEMVNPHGDAVIKRIASGLGTVVVGVVLLCNSFGIIPWGVWFNMLALWPLLIVAIGIELVGKGLRLDWVRALSNVLLILGLLYGVFVMGPGWRGSVFGFAPAPGRPSSFNESVPHNATVRGGDASISVGAMRLQVGAGEGLVAIRGEGAGGAEPSLKSEVTNGRANVEIDDPSDAVFILPAPDRALFVQLDRAVGWDGIDLSVGAVDADVDLSEINVDRVDVNVGASHMRLTVGARAPKVVVEVSGGATAVTVRVPESAMVTLTASSGLSALSVPDSFRHVRGTAILGEGVWSKRGTGGPEISIALKSGVSALNIETY